MSFSISDHQNSKRVKVIKFQEVSLTQPMLVPKKPLRKTYCSAEEQLTVRETGKKMNWFIIPWLVFKILLKEAKR